MKLCRRPKFLLSGLYFLLCSAAAAGQNGDYGNSISNAEKAFISEQLIEQYWGNSTAVYEAKVPGKYNRSPAVILEQTVRREFYRNSRNFLRTINLEHKIVLLKDRNGVEEHSIFGFEKINSPFAFDVLAVKVIKPDGREHIVDMDSATVTRNEKGVNVERYVIPGLEVGDIIDYFYYLEFRVLFPQQYTRIFDPVYWLPQGKYPVLHCDLEFIVGPSAFLNASSFKLPAFRKTNYKIDNKTFSRYELSVDDLPEIRLDLPYYHPFRELPHLRYQVFISPYSGNTGIVYNLGGSLKLNTDVQRSRLQDFLVFTLKSGREYRPQYKAFRKYLRDSAGKPRKLKADRLAKDYYLWEQDRHALARLSGRSAALDDLSFASKAHYMLKKMNVEHDLVLGFDRSLTDIGQFLLTDEISPLIRILENDTILMSNPADDGLPGLVPPLLEATEGFAFDPGSLELSKTELPGTDARNNLVLTDIKVVPGHGGSGTISRTCSATGHDNEAMSKLVVNIPQQFLMQGSAGYRNLFHYNQRSSRSAKERTEMLEDRFEVREAEIRDNILQMMDGESSEVLNLAWEVTAAERNDQLDTLTWKMDYSLPEMAVRAGSGFILPLRKLLDIPEIDRESLSGRSHNLYFDYPYSRSWIIRVDQMPGYEIQIPDDIDKSIYNDAGSFRSAAVLHTSHLELRIDLDQTNRMLPAEKSGQLLELIDACLDVLDKRLLYRKLE